MDTFELIDEKVEICKRKNGELAIRMPLHGAYPEGSRITLELGVLDRELLEELSAGDEEVFHTYCRQYAIVLGTFATMRQRHIIVSLRDRYTGELLWQVMEEGIKSLIDQVYWMLRQASEMKGIDFLDEDDETS